MRSAAAPRASSLARVSASWPAERATRIRPASTSASPSAIAWPMPRPAPVISEVRCHCSLLRDGSYGVARERPPPVRKIKIVIPNGQRLTAPAIGSPDGLSRRRHVLAHVAHQPGDVLGDEPADGPPE